MKIALIAHDKKKDEIIELAKRYKEVLAKYELYATGTTGSRKGIESIRFWRKNNGVCFR